MSLFVLTRSRSCLCLLCWAGYPHFTEHSKTSSGLYKQKYHLLGALVHGRGMYVYTMSHKFPADPNTTIEVLQRTLTKLSEEGPLPRKFYLQMDNCVRENKNQALFAYLSWLVQRNIFDSIEVSFLPVGHTHEDIDQVWSRTGIALAAQNVCCQEELFALIENAYHHEGFTAHCESIDRVANIKDWLLEHCNYVAGLAGREILHFKIFQHEDGPAIQTKHRSENTWRDTGHVYDTPSHGFHLLRATVPRLPLAAEVARPPPLQPKVQDPKVIKRLQSALDECRRDIRVTSAAFESLMRSLNDFCNSDELTFAWVSDGQFPCERDAYGRIGDTLQSLFRAGAYQSSAAVRMWAEIEQDAEDEHLLQANSAQARHASDDENTEAEDDSNERAADPIGLRTKDQEKQRKAMEDAADQKDNFRVDKLGASHFVIFRPSDKQRQGDQQSDSEEEQGQSDDEGAAAAAAGQRKGSKKAAAPAKKAQLTRDRPFWVGRVYEDWDNKNGVRKQGVDPHTGKITVHNYTPYNVKGGAASSNKVAKEYQSYQTEHNVQGQALWTRFHRSQVILELSHLIPDSNTKGRLPFFKLPKFAKDILLAMFPPPKDADALDAAPAAACAPAAAAAAADLPSKRARRGR